LSFLSCATLHLTFRLEPGKEGRHERRENGGRLGFGAYEWVGRIPRSGGQGFSRPVSIAQGVAARRTRTTGTRCFRRRIPPVRVQRPVERDRRAVFAETGEAPQIGRRRLLGERLRRLADRPASRCNWTGPKRRADESDLDTVLRQRTHQVSHLFARKKRQTKGNRGVSAVWARFGDGQNAFLSQLGRDSVHAPGDCSTTRFKSGDSVRPSRSRVHKAFETRGDTTPGASERFEHLQKGFRKGAGG
jgi:hypothetical protein